jgi:hypothetical protein
MTSAVGCTAPCEVDAMMMGRAEVVDVLVTEGITEPLAWKIAITLSPAFLDDLQTADLRQSVDNILWEHMERTGELDCTAPL